jgi:hypothetical protein
MNFKTSRQIAMRIRCERGANMVLYHGTTVKIFDGLASGTYFTDDINVAKTYASKKSGGRIYAYTIMSIKDFGRFKLDVLNEHLVSTVFIPLDRLDELNYCKPRSEYI